MWNFLDKLYIWFAYIKDESNFVWQTHYWAKIRTEKPTVSVAAFFRCVVVNICLTHGYETAKISSVLWLNKTKHSVLLNCHEIAFQKLHPSIGLLPHTRVMPVIQNRNWLMSRTYSFRSINTISWILQLFRMYWSWSVV